MRVTFYDESVFSTFCDWAKNNKKVYDKIIELIKDIKRSPFEGLGKPESLKYNLSGCWSRRITEEHRLVYKIENNDIIVLSCKDHY
jgi:toxin YoeB